MLLGLVFVGLQIDGKSAIDAGGPVGTGRYLEVLYFAISIAGKDATCWQVVPSEVNFASVPADNYAAPGKTGPES